MSNEISIAIVTAVATLLGAIVGGLAGFGGAWLKERYADKRRKRELIINSAIEDWSKHFDVLAKQTRIHGNKMMPLDNYIAHYAIILKAALEEDFDINRFKDALKKSEEVIKEYLLHNEELGGISKAK